MPRAISVAVVVVVAVVLAVTWTVKRRSAPAPPSASESAQAAPSGTAEAPPPQAQQSDESDSVEEPPAQLPAIPAPTAAWLHAPANPLSVTVTVSDREAQRRITPAGGTVSATTADGTRISLTFPPGSLWRSEEVTIRVVEGLGGAPFAAAAAVVSITPEDVPLHKPPVLQFEPGRRSSFDGSRGIAGFAVRGGSELSLYPAGLEEIERAPGRYRMMMALTRLGTYGVTNATDEEIAAVGAREPRDLGARLEARIALAYATPAPGSDPAPASASWSLIPRLHAQGGVSLFIYGLIKQLLEYYEQVVVPKFDKLPTSDCLSGATFDAISTYLGWRLNVELLLPMQAAPDGPLDEVFLKLVAQRVTMLRDRGYTSEQIDEIDRVMEQFRDGFSQMTARIDARIRPALTSQFAALYRCCTTQRPMRYHLTAMHRVMQFAEVNGYAPIDPDPTPKLFECACIVGANQPGAEERFVGTLSYEETTALKKSGQRNSRASVNSETLNFHQSSVLTFPSEGFILAQSVARGSLARLASVTDDHGTCVVHSESQVSVEGTDHDTGVVGIDVNVPQGTYTLSFERVSLEGSGSRRSIWNVRGPGCGPFNKARDETRWEKLAIAPVSARTVRGTLNPERPQELKGSQTFEQKDVFYDATRTATLKWDLQRCKR